MVLMIATHCFPKESETFYSGRHGEEEVRVDLVNAEERAADIFQSGDYSRLAGFKVDDRDDGGDDKSE